MPLPDGPTSTPAAHLDDDALSALLDAEREVSPGLPSDALVHVDECAACEGRLTDLRHVAALLSALPELDVPRDFTLGPRLVQREVSVQRLARWYTGARVLAAAMAALFVVTSGATLLGPGYQDLFRATSPAALVVSPRTGPTGVTSAAGGSAATENKAAAPAGAGLSAGAAGGGALAAQPGAQSSGSTQAAAPAAPPPPAPAPAAAARSSAQTSAQAVPAPAGAADSAVSGGTGAPRASSAAPAAAAARNPAAESAAEPTDQFAAVATPARPLPTPTSVPPPVAAPAPAAAPTAPLFDALLPLLVGVLGVVTAGAIVAALAIRHRLRRLRATSFVPFTDPDQED